ncbi:MAG: DUF4351 domain-containing protein [Cyanobacteria bacterium J06626_18]
MKNTIMQESVIYQDIKAEGIQEGLQEGLRQGLQRGLQQKRQLILRLLNRQVGTVTAALVEQVESLSSEQLESLGEALLDFNEMSDLANWLADHK